MFPSDREVLPTHGARLPEIALCPIAAHLGTATSRPFGRCGCASGAEGVSVLGPLIVLQLVDTLAALKAVNRWRAGMLAPVVAAGRAVPVEAEASPPTVQDAHGATYGRARRCP